MLRDPFRRYVGNRRAQEEYAREEVPLAMTRTHAHNIWLQVAASAACWARCSSLLAASVFREAIVSALPRARGLPHALAGRVAGRVDGFHRRPVQNNFGDSQVALLFWLVAGIAVVCGRAAAAQAAPAPAGGVCR
jgi:hypothetical protein